MNRSRLLLVPALSALVVAAAGFAAPAARSALLVPQLVPVALGMLLWTALLWARGVAPEATFVLRRAHWVQALMHTSLYVHWGLYWDEVGAHAPLILAQVAFAYGFDALLTFTRGRRWSAALGHIPIIGSTNLFLWFHDDCFALQFALVASIFLTKHFLRWRPGTGGAAAPGDLAWGHVFNPSAIGVSLAAVGLIAADRTGLTWGAEISANLGLSPSMYHHIFLCGVVVQTLFGVVLLTASAGLFLWAAGAVYLWATGLYFFVDTTIPIAVFLGLTLLMTDPVTSPRRPLGRVLFGAGYGALVMVWYALLGGADGPGYYDKILPVPFLNLAAPAIDALALRLEGHATRLAVLWASARARGLHVVGWVAAYALMLATGALGAGHPGLEPAFWTQACTEGRTGIQSPCAVLRALHAQRCARDVAADCVALGLLESGTTGQRDAGAPADLAAARDAFAHACLLGDLSGCTDAAFLLERGEGGERNPALALRLLTQACEGGNAGGCRNLAVGLQAGALGLRDTPGALRALRRACELRDADSCRRLAALEASPAR